MRVKLDLEYTENEPLHDLFVDKAGTELLKLLKKSPSL